MYTCSEETLTNSIYEAKAYLCFKTLNESKWFYVIHLLFQFLLTWMPGNYFIHTIFISCLHGRKNKGICHRPKSQCFVCRENIRRAVTIFTKNIIMHLCKICTNSCTWNINIKKKTLSETKRNQPEGVEKWLFR